MAVSSENAFGEGFVNVTVRPGMSVWGKGLLLYRLAPVLGAWMTCDMFFSFTFGSVEKICKDYVFACFPNTSQYSPDTTICRHRFMASCP